MTKEEIKKEKDKQKARNSIRNWISNASTDKLHWLMDAIMYEQDKRKD